MLPDRICRLLTAYVDGELDRQQRKALVRVLRRSAEARELLRGLQKDADQLRSLPRLSLGEEFAQQVLQVIRRRQAESARSSAGSVVSNVPRWVGLAAAAAVLLVLGLGSYIYFAGGDRRRPDELVAVRVPQPDGSSPAAETAAAPIAAPALARANAREPLGPPAPERDPKPFSTPVLPRVEEAQPRVDPKQRLLASEVGKEVAPFKDPDEAIPLIFSVRDLVQKKAQQQLHQALQKGDSHWLDLRCRDTRAGIERLQTAFRAQGIQFLMDQDAQAVLKLGLGADTPLAVYCDELTAHELVRILQQLGSDVRSSRFDRLLINALPPEGRHKLSWMLGIAAAQLDRAGTPGSETKKPALPASERQAFVVAYTPGRPRATSAQLKRFLEQRKEPRADTIRILLVLSSTKG